MSQGFSMREVYYVSDERPFSILSESIYEDVGNPVIPSREKMTKPPKRVIVRNRIRVMIILLIIIILVISAAGLTFYLITKSESQPTQSHLIRHGSKVIFKNVRPLGGYLYSGPDKVSHDNQRRNVFAQTYLVFPKVGIWVLEEDKRFPGSYRIKSDITGEYLYAAEDQFKYDKERRQIFTWRDSNPDLLLKEKSFYWDFVLNDEEKGHYIIKNVEFGDGMYQDGNDFGISAQGKIVNKNQEEFLDDESRRIVFAWHDLETIGIEGNWIIESAPEVPTKLVVALGYQGSQSLSDIEVVDISSVNTDCKNLEDFPWVNRDSQGGLGPQNNPIICGGQEYRSSCMSYDQNSWRQMASLNTGRAAYAMTKSPYLDETSLLLVTGGWGDAEVLDSVEVLNKTGWHTIQPMPKGVWRHCMVRINSTTVLVIGGHQDSTLNVTAETYFFNSKTLNWNQGPSLMKERAVMTCGMINKDKRGLERNVIVAGGWENWQILSSVEILDLEANEWRKGFADLPYASDDAVMVEDPSGGVIVVGGYNGEVERDTLARLSHSGRDAEWEIMSQKLKTPRRYHTIFLIPDELTDCKEDRQKLSLK